MTDDTQETEVYRFRGFPVLSTLIMLGAFVVPVFGSAFLGIELLDWMLSQADYTEPEYLGYALGIGAGWIGLILGQKLFYVEPLKSHIIRADNFFKTFEYPLGDRDD